MPIAEECVICSSASIKPFRHASRAIHECADCEHRFVSDRRRARDLVAELYSSPDYFLRDRQHQGIVDVLDTPRSEAGWAGFLGARRGALEVLGINVETPRGRRSMEIGCLEGRLVKLLKDCGWDAHGLEPNATVAAPAAFALGVPIATDTIEEWTPEENTYDLVLSFHVFEHLLDPKAALTKIRSALKPGGEFVLEVPLNEDEYDNPDHLHFFSEKSAQTLATQLFGTTAFRNNFYVHGGHAARTGSIYMWGRKGAA